VFRRFHRARPAVAAVGLGRRPPDGPERLPSNWSRTSRPERARPRLLFTRVVSPRPCRSPRAMPPPWTEAPFRWRRLPRSKACGVASCYLALRADRGTVAGPFDLRETARKMRLSDFCNRLTSRAPSDCPIPGCTLAPHDAFRRLVARVTTHPGPKPRGDRLGACRSACRMSLPGGASLDGEPPASTIVAERSCVSARLSPAASRTRRRTVLVGPFDRPLRALPPGMGAVRPQPSLRYRL